MRFDDKCTASVFAEELDDHSLARLAEAIAAELFERKDMVGNEFHKWRQERARLLMDAARDGNREIIFEVLPP